MKHSLEMTVVLEFKGKDLNTETRKQLQKDIEKGKYEIAEFAPNWHGTQASAGVLTIKEK